MPSGGSNAVAAWTLQALRDDLDLSLATLAPVDCAGLNLSFGTALREEDFQVRVAPRGLQKMSSRLPTRGALVDLCLTMRWAQELDRQNRYDALFSTENEMDFHRRGIQYIHHPWLYLPRPDAEMHWYHRIPGTLAVYRKSCLMLAHASARGLSENVTLANSRFVADRFRSVYGTCAAVVCPPVPGDFQNLPWEQRRNAVAAVGRIDPIKRWEFAVETVESLRQRGHDLELTLMGHSNSPSYVARMEAMSTSRPWFRVIRDVSRTDLLAELSRHRYGIHPMEDEHFGIAPAEMLRAGCLPFVHNSGGAVEIVGGDSRLTFEGVNDASLKIANVLENPALERELRAQMGERRDEFTTEKFCRSVQQIVAQFVQDGAGRT